MKTILLLLIFSTPLISLSQDDTLDYELVSMPDLEPQFPGGAKALNAYLVENVVFTEKPGCLAGKIYISFAVEIDGSISNVRIERGICQEYDRLVQEAFRNMPKWIPGIREGKAVKSRVALPVFIHLD